MGREEGVVIEAVVDSAAVAVVVVAAAAVDGAAAQGMQSLGQDVHSVVEEQQWRWRVNEHSGVVVAAGAVLQQEMPWLWGPSAQSRPPQN